MISSNLDSKNNLNKNYISCPEQEIGSAQIVNLDISKSLCFKCKYQKTNATKIFNQTYQQQINNPTFTKFVKQSYDKQRKIATYHAWSVDRRWRRGRISSGIREPGRSDWRRFINCPQHIQPRWTKEELVAREYDRDRIERLENENRQLRKELTVKASVMPLPNLPA